MSERAFALLAFDPSRYLIAKNVMEKNIRPLSTTVITTSAVNSASTSGATVEAAAGEYGEYRASSAPSPDLRGACLLPAFPAEHQENPSAEEQDRQGPRPP